jgi:hypothetical protein
VSETVELVATINATWRLMKIAGGRWGSGAWHIQNVDNDRAGAIFRVSHMTRSFIAARCGPLDSGVADILAGLPDRCDRTGPPKRYRRKRPAKPADVPMVAPVSPPPRATIAARAPQPACRPTPERLEVIRATAKRIKRLDAQVAP